MTYLGIFAPIVGVVRFWGIAVVIPAIFATLFGPYVGGLGAAIGIFVSDMVVHGNALLSLTVGVPANFVMFFLIGWLAKREFNTKFRLTGISLGAFGILSVFAFRWSAGGGGDYLLALIFSLFCLITIVLLFIVDWRWPKWRGFVIGAIAGNALGSAIVGIGVWGFSQFFVLPNLGHKLTSMTALIWFAWTFSNQMPFLLLMVPPILEACRRAFPSRTLDM